MKSNNGYAMDTAKSVLLKDGSVVADLIPTSMFSGEYEVRFTSREAEASWHGFCGELSTSEMLEILSMEVAQ